MLRREEWMKYKSEEEIKELVDRTDKSLGYPLAQDYPIGTELKRYSYVYWDRDDHVDHAITCLAASMEDAQDYAVKVYGLGFAFLHEENMEQMRPEDLSTLGLVRYVVCIGAETLEGGQAWRDRCFTSYPDAIACARYYIESGEEWADYADVKVMVLRDGQEWESDGGIDYYRYEWEAEGEAYWDTVNDTE